MAAKRLSLLTGSAVAVVAASAAWLTGGALSRTSLQPAAVRIGLLPPPAWLLVWLAAALLARSSLGVRGHRFTLLTLTAVLFAPWMPWQPPAAFLVWAGPLRYWLWVVVLLGLLAPALVRRAPAWVTRTARDARRAPWLAAGIAAIAYFAGANQIFTRLPTGDEPHYLVIAQSLIKDHDLKIEKIHRRGDYHDYYNGTLSPDYLRRGVNGEIYSIHAPGLAVIVAPALAVFGYPGVLAMLALVSAWATALTWIAAWRVTADAAASWFGWATAALSAPFFFQAFVVYPDAPGAALIMVGVLALVGGPRLSSARLIATGAALAILPWLHTRLVIAAIVLAVMIVARLILERHNKGPEAGRDAGVVRRVAALLSIPLLSAICWFWFFYAIYGSPDPRAPYAGSTQSDTANLARGIVGLLFDQQFGVLPAAPVLLCAAAGLIVLIRQSRRTAAALVLLIAPYCVAVGAFQMWWGGTSSPGRFIVPVMLPLAIPAAVWYHSRRGHTGRLLGLGALAISVLTTMTLAGVDEGVLLYNVRDGSSRLLTWLSPLVNVTTALPSVFQTSPSAALLRGLVWIGAIGLTAAAGFFIERRGAAPAAVALSLGFAAMAAAAAAMTILWRDNGISPIGAEASSSPATLAPATSALLRSFDPDSRQVMIRYGPIRRIRMRDALKDLTLAESVVDPLTHEAPAIGLFHLPAGVYAIQGEGRTAGPLTIGVYDEFPPQWSWNLGDQTDGWRREFHLPVPAPAMVIKAPGARRLVVRPVSVDRPGRWFARTEPEHVVRYGPAVVFAMSGRAFMEPGGIWVEGGGTEDFVIEADRGVPVRLLVRTSPVANTVSLESDDWRQFLVLAPGEERLIPLPLAPLAPTDAMRLRVTVAHGARPTEFEPGSTDSRYLGCRIEIRP
jgi:hypothetical protein